MCRCVPLVILGLLWDYNLIWEEDVAANEVYPYLKTCFTPVI
jgi:hypothetical protein